MYGLLAVLLVITLVNIGVLIIADGSFEMTFGAPVIGDPYVVSQQVIFVEAGVPLPAVAWFTRGGQVRDTPPPSFELVLDATGDNLTVTFAVSSFNRSNTASLSFQPEPEFLREVELHHQGVQERTTFVAGSGEGIMELPIPAGSSFTMVNVSEADTYDLDWRGPHPSPEHQTQRVTIARFTVVDESWTVETCPDQSFEC